MKKIKGQISNKVAKMIAAVEDPGDCCGNCRYYRVNRWTGKGHCVIHDLRTVVIAWCGQWERKDDGSEA